MEKIRNKEIYEKFQQGVSAEDISKEMGVSRARIYQIINAQEKVRDKVMIDDSVVVKELKERIKALEDELKRCHSIIDRLLEK